ncbi:MAG: hypothetical protein GY760_13920, partial [Deltaproteobacteria bacterium]|nr:hypothetical protein [Deltaproteobacteria bacterium]
SESFGIFLDEYGSEGYMDILDEFFQSHPDMEYRRDKFYERAKGLSQGYEKYIGKKNLEKRKAMSVSEFYMEWKEFSIEE